MSNWSDWRTFPPATTGNALEAPREPGVYELRHKSTGQLIYVGESRTTAKRMKSLLPQPYGSGKRNNSELRAYVLANVADVEYRTLECETKEEAKRIQDEFHANQKYIFHT